MRGNFPKRVVSLFGNRNGLYSTGPRQSKERHGIRMHIQGVRIPSIWVCVTHLVSRSPHGLWYGAQDSGGLEGAMLHVDPGVPRRREVIINLSSSRGAL